MIESIILGGGCFWCTEAVFKMLKGVVDAKPGYAGGDMPNPSYEDVCNGTTGHAEVIKLDYNPSVIKLDDILTVFFATHDPTTLNRQGNDVGTQYRSVIFYENEAQKSAVEKFVSEINASSTEGRPIVTEVLPYKNFYEAENYHQNYYARNQDAGYCQAVINPKLKKVKEKFATLLA